MTGYDFRVTLRDKTYCEYTTPSGERGACTPTDIKLDEHLETIRVLEEWLKRWEWIAKADKDGGRLLVPSTFVALGEHLWKLAFDGDVGDQIVKAYRTVTGPGADLEADLQVTVRLAFGPEAADGLENLPWEFLNYPGAGKPNFLGAAPHMVFGRFVDGVADAHVRTADTKLHVLLVVTLPRTDDFLEERAELVKMTQALQDIDTIKLERRDSWDPEEIGRTLADFKREGAVDVVHLVAVCKTQKKKPWLFMGDGDGGRLMDAQPIVDLLMQDAWNRPALVVLHLSDWETDSSEHFEQLGPAFIREGVPAVMAMQYPMPPEQGRQFVRSLYEKLAGGERIGTAVQTARQGLLLGKPPNRRWGTPVLYMQSPADSTLLARPAEVPADNDDVLAGVAPTGARLSAARRAPARGSFGPALLAVLDDEDPSEAVSGLRRWIDEQDWPASPEAVRLALEAERRERLDDRVVRTMFDKLIASVRERAEGARHGS